jgi:hypothetical protein
MPADANPINLICCFTVRSEPGIERARVGEREILLITGLCEPSEYWIVSIDIGSAARGENH